MKGVFVILDGVADQPCPSLNGKTPLEAAKTPNLDEISKKSKIDFCHVVREGFAPESSSAIISLFGYDPNNAPRGELEAVGMGLNLKNGDLALRCNFATISDLEEGTILDSRAGRNLTTEEAKTLAKAINEKVKLPFKFEFYPSVQHRGVLIIRGGFSDNISNANPFYDIGAAKIVENPKMIYSKSFDDEDNSKLSAELVNNFIRQSFEILDKHPLNIQRAKKGFYKANIILCRDAGSELIRLNKLKGKWMALGYMPLEIGIGKLSGMEIYRFKYPKFKGNDVYANIYSGLNKAIRNAKWMLWWNKRKCDYFYIHLKETDIPGHDNKPIEKVKMIEMIDKKFFSFLKKYAEKNKAKLIITADHTTSCRLKGHTADPVPVLTFSPENPEDKSHRFTEAQGLKGRKIASRKLLEENLF